MFNPFTEVAESDTTDADLVEQVKNGDRVALERLVLRHQAWIYNTSIFGSSSSSKATRSRRWKLSHRHAAKWC